MGLCKCAVCYTSPPHARYMHVTPLINKPRSLLIHPTIQQVIYGDTDSVMVNFGYSTVEDAMPAAKKAAEEVSVCV